MQRKGIGILLVAVGLGVGIANAGEGQWRDGADLYAKVCGHCHEANVGPVLQGRSLPAAYVERVVRFGNRAMPAFRPSEIDDATLADVARMINASAQVAKKE